MLPKVCEKMFSIVRRNGLFATKSPKFIGLYFSTHTDSHAVYSYDETLTWTQRIEFCS